MGRRGQEIEMEYGSLLDKARASFGETDAGYDLVQALIDALEESQKRNSVFFESLDEIRSELSCRNADLSQSILNARRERNRLVRDLSMVRLEVDIIQWATDRGIFEHSDPKTQFAKTISEVGELADAIAKGECVKDHIGDIQVTLILLAHMRGTHMLECLGVAWDEIKDRKGKIVNGTFVKDGG